MHGLRVRRDHRGHRGHHVRPRHRGHHGHPRHRGHRDRDHRGWYLLLGRLRFERLSQGVFPVG